MEKIIDIKKLEGARSLGSDFNKYILGDIIEESLEKLKDAVNINGSNNQYGYTFNNIFIDGSRGSGKTTVLLTLRDILSNRNELYRNKLQKYGLQDKKFIIIDSLLDTSVNKESITFYFLSWLKKEIEEKYQTNHDLMEQLYKTIKLFPSKSEKIDDIEEKLDRSDLSFRNELFKLIDGYLNNSCSQDFLSKENSFIVLFLDDLDISFPIERIQEILTEIFLFLSHPNVIVIGAGDYNNLVKMLTKYVSKEIEDKQIKDNLFYINISKSYLEKTFATHLVRLYRLKYEQIANIKIEEYTGETKSLKDYLEENINIVKILNFDSPIFKTLFNDITIRELILILKNVSFMKAKKKRNENKKEEEDNENLVIDFCFSHILNKYLNIDLDIKFDARFSTKKNDRDKNSEFEYIAKKLEESLQNKDKNFFFKEENHSLVTLSLEVEKDSKKTALFWLWLYENFIYMDGLNSNLIRIFLIDLISFIDSSIEEPLFDLNGKYLTEEFIKIWKLFNYEISEIIAIYENFDRYINFEQNFAVPLSKDNILSSSELVLKKGNKEYLHLLKILHFLSILSKEFDISEEIFAYLNIGEEDKNVLYKFILLLDNVKDKILKNIKDSNPEKRYFYFLSLYFNILYRVTFPIKFLDKEIYFQAIYELLEKLYISDESVAKFQINKETFELLKKQYNWWKNRNFKRSRIKKILEKLNELESIFQETLSKEGNNIVTIEKELFHFLREIKNLKSLFYRFERYDSEFLDKKLKEINELVQDKSVPPLRIINPKSIDKSLQKIREFMLNNFYLFEKSKNKGILKLEETSKLDFITFLFVSYLFSSLLKNKKEIKIFIDKNKDNILIKDIFKCYQKNINIIDSLALLYEFFSLWEKGQLSVDNLKNKLDTIKESLSSCKEIRFFTKLLEVIEKIRRNED